MIVMKRAYAPASDSDGYRVLIDRLWPREISNAKARIDAWEKEIAPSPELRCAGDMSDAAVLTRLLNRRATGLTGRRYKPATPARAVRAPREKRR